MPNAHCLPQFVILFYQSKPFRIKRYDSWCILGVDIKPEIMEKKSMGYKNMPDGGYNYHDCALWFSMLLECYTMTM